MAVMTAPQHAVDERALERGEVVREERIDRHRMLVSAMHGMSIEEIGVRAR